MHNEARSRKRHRRALGVAFALSLAVHGALLAFGNVSVESLISPDRFTADDRPDHPWETTPMEVVQTRSADAAEAEEAAEATDAAAEASVVSFLNEAPAEAAETTAPRAEQAAAEQATLVSVEPVERAAEAVEMPRVTPVERKVDSGYMTSIFSPNDRDEEFRSADATGTEEAVRNAGRRGGLGGGGGVVIGGGGACGNPASTGLINRRVPAGIVGPR